MQSLLLALELPGVQHERDAIDGLIVLDRRLHGGLCDARDTESVLDRGFIGAHDGRDRVSGALVRDPDRAERVASERLKASSSRGSASTQR